MEGNEYYIPVSCKDPMIPFQSIVTIENASHTGSIAIVKRIRTDLTWDMVLQEAFSYYVGTGKSSVASCRSCGYQFSKAELRVRFDVNRLQQGCVMPACEVNVCMNSSCITNPYHKYSSKPLVCLLLVLIL